ncbi:MAG: alpha/beta fold hydrolase [Lachnospiraceae bacterium]|nr:alpha/beta fold hydrolase [Lachnospiraceae bacterium]
MSQKGKTIVALTGLAVISIHVINRLQYSHATSKNILACSENNYYEWRFGKIRYTKKGNGTPILLLHDLTVGSSNYEFHSIINSLSKDHEVYAIDFLGYGLSDRPNMTFTNFLYVQLISDFIKNVIGKRTDIIATGDAAPVSIMACHNDFDLINKMIFINPTGLFDLNKIPSKRTKALKLLFDSPIIGTLLYNHLTSKTAIEKTFREEYFYDSYKIQEKDILSYVEAAHTSDYNSKFSFTSHVAHYMNCNIIHALKEINNSIYIIGGKEKDNIETTVDNYIYYNSSIESDYIEKTKHLPHLERPEEVIKLLELYLN